MTLMMYLGNDLIEAIPVSTDKLSQPGYLGSFKRLLKQKHFVLLQQSSIEPEFLVFDLNPVKERLSSSSAYASVSSGQALEAGTAWR
jgi:hypothetical protein